MAGDGHMQGDISDFAQEMKKLVNSKDHSDIRFVIGPNRKNIYAHKCVLAARCPVFGAMFADQSQKNGSPEKDVPFVLSDMSPDVFLSVLEFIYTNCVTLKKDSAIDVLATALEYGLDELRKYICGYPPPSPEEPNPYVPPTFKENLIISRLSSRNLMDIPQKLSTGP